MTTPDEGRRPATNGKSAGAAAATDILQRDAWDEPRWNNAHEMSTLGALLWAGTDWATIDHISEQLEGGVDTFYRPTHGRIYELLMELRRAETPLGAGQVITLMTPKDFQATQNGTYLAKLMEAEISPASGGYFARQVSAAYVLRKADEQQQRNRQRIASTTLIDARDTIEIIQRETSLLSAGPVASSIRTWDELASGAIDDVMALQDRLEEDESNTSGIGTGWDELDEVLGGWQRDQLIIWCARPGMGKTIAGLNVAQHTSMRLGLPFLWFSMEMSAEECVKRMLCAGAGISWTNFRDGKLSDEELIKALRYVEDTKGAPFAVDDTVGMTASHITNQSRAYYRQQGGVLGGLGWDYLQLTSPDASQRHKKREEIVSEWSWSGKMLARELHTTVHMLAQLNRGPEQRTDKKPQLGDLRESGTIEQNADVVIGLHREDYYDKDSARKGEVDFCVLKQRNGPTKDVPLAAQLHMARFWTMRF